MSTVPSIPANYALLTQVIFERQRAHDKHGATSMESTHPGDPTGRRYRVLSEEVAEVARELNDAEHEQRPIDWQAIRAELIQVAAMAYAWADAVEQLLNTQDPEEQ